MLNCSYYWEPDYYPRFACKCGDCRNLCCTGWEVDISQRDYFRLIGMDCSDELHRKIECAFVSPECPSEQKFKILAPNWYGLCPFLSDARLCSLQLECGASAIPDVCRLYPRSLKTINGSRRACCSASCEAVASLLMREEPLVFSLRGMKDAPEMSEQFPAGDLQEEKTCLRLMQDRSLPVAERVKRICRDMNQSFVPIPLDKLLQALPIFSETSANFTPCAEKLLRCPREELNPGKAPSAFPSWEKWLENLLVNHMFYCDFPCCDKRIREEQSSYGLYAAWMLLNLCCSDKTISTREALEDTVSAVFHLLEHTAFYHNCAILFN